MRSLEKNFSYREIFFLKININSQRPIPYTIGRSCIKIDTNTDAGNDITHSLLEVAMIMNHGPATLPAQ